jgi:hypothetical protein
MKKTEMATMSESSMEAMLAARCKSASLMIKKMLIVTATITRTISALIPLERTLLSNMID